jgi:beta-glucosidase
MTEAKDIGLTRKFKEGLMWGTATAPFQVEEKGERKTDWDSFVERKKIVLPGEQGPNYWVPGNAERDFADLKALGTNAQRLGIEWGRIEPEQGKICQEALRRDREIIDFLKKNGITPMVTLNHFVLPEWVARQGGWENKSIRGGFKNYAHIIAENFPDVPYYITINEPNVLAAAGWAGGAWPPEKKGIGGLLTALHSVSPNMIAAHELAGNELTRQSGSGKVGIANAISWYKPENANSPLDRIPGAIADALFNYKFLKGTIENSDFEGINFYSGYRLKFRNGFNGHNQKDMPMAMDELPFGKVVRHEEDVLSDVGWPIVPGYFLEALKYNYSKFKKPIIITENGIADREDKLRSFYILTHLIAMHEAMRSGVDVRGYFHWSAVDNLEWAEGFAPRFGLIARDPKTGERAIRQSAQLYGEIAKSDEIDVNRLGEKYLTPEQRELTKKFLQSLPHSA